MCFLIQLSSIAPVYVGVICSNDQMSSDFYIFLEKILNTGS